MNSQLHANADLLLLPVRQYGEETEKYIQISKDINTNKQRNKQKTHK